MEKKELFERVFKDYYPKVYAYLSAQTNSVAAEDIAQQTFLAVWEYILCGERRIRNWRALVFSVAYNKKNDYYRRQYACGEIYGLESVDKTVEFEADERISFERAFARLEHEERDLLLMVGSGLNSREISETTGVNASTVRNRVKAARERLKAAMAEEGAQ